MLGFFLNGALLPNNSIVLFHGIGENSSALYCLTDRKQCCSSISGMRIGRWDFPNGSRVPNDKDVAGIYIRRGFSSIRLNRKSDNIVTSTGVYTCLIPDSNSTSRRILRIGIYSNVSQGKFSADLASTKSLDPSLKLLCVYMQELPSCDNAMYP